jgi:hypothetical protein
MQLRACSIGLHAQRAQRCGQHLVMPHQQHELDEPAFVEVLAQGVPSASRRV